MGRLAEGQKMPHLWNVYTLTHFHVHTQNCVYAHWYFGWLQWLKQSFHQTWNCTTLFYLHHIRRDSPRIYPFTKKSGQISSFSHFLCNLAVSVHSYPLLEIQVPVCLQLKLTFSISYLKRYFFFQFSNLKNVFQLTNLISGKQLLTFCDL